jgi:hypothetical protein
MMLQKSSQLTQNIPVGSGVKTPVVGDSTVNVI